MLKVLVRSKRDADAVKSTLEAFKINDVEVKSLKGARGAKLADIILDNIDNFTIVLLGREDKDVVELIKEDLPPFTEVIVAETKRVRNSTPGQILSLIDKGRASLRLSTYWKGTYRLSRTYGAERLAVPVDPQGDSFFLFRKGLEILSEITGLKLRGTAMIFKLSKGKHKAFLGPQEVAELYVGPFIESLKVLKTFKVPEKIYIDLNDVVRENLDLINILEKEAVRILREEARDIDTALVPWSGGKDSTASLILATKAFGRDRVKAIYVDTGVDFQENLYYIEKVASLLKVDYYVYKADVADLLLKGEMPLPSPRNRWCTYRKLLALRKAFKELSRGKTYVIVGDRDAESESRARRSLVRLDESGLPLIAPLKLWSASHVEAYIVSKGLPLNPLYELGFYRIGCYICFALRSWELVVMKKSGLIEKVLRSRPFHKYLIREFLRSKSSVTDSLENINCHG
jgi:3'-phosphoadenosine 5'-phosphosulfate sulfotransferase (PAPS reductase)/FAD synthetase/3'-phosphoadenosine 5'-phosphosulfate sulfotransferase